MNETEPQADDNADSVDQRQVNLVDRTQEPMLFNDQDAVNMDGETKGGVEMQEMTSNSAQNQVIPIQGEPVAAAEGATSCYESGCQN